MEFDLVQKLDAGGALYRPAQPISFSRAMDLLEESEGAGAAFRGGLERLITGAGEQVFFECPPTRLKSLETQGFEFVILPTNELRGAAVMMEDVAFRDHLVAREENDLAVSFESLGRDATMVSPLPDLSEDSRSSRFTHLRAFMGHASDERRKALWKEVSRSFRARLNSADGRQVWLSTHGGGVPYLHFRICEQPRYYHHRPFAEMVVDV